MNLSRAIVGLILAGWAFIGLTCSAGKNVLTRAAYTQGH